MINHSKKHLFTTTTTMIIICALALAGCTNTNRLIVPDGSKRVPINRDAIVNGASIHQDLIVKHDEAA